jgi:hypothetical protein
MLNHSKHTRRDVDMVTARINDRFGAPLVARS